MKRETMLAALAAMTVALGGATPSCTTADRLAEQGLPSRGPMQIGVEFGEDGNITKAQGAATGGGSSVLHATRKTYWENGSPKSDFLFSSDPTLVQQAYYGGVANQSQLDYTHFSQGLMLVSSQIQNMLPIMTQTVADLREMSRETAQDRADRLAREARLDAKFEQVLDLFQQQAGERQDE